MSDTSPAIVRWQIDKHVPVALLAAMLLQVLGGIVAATLIYADVRDHGRQIEQLKIESRERDSRTHALGDALLRLQGMTEALRETVADLRATIRAVRGDGR